MTNYTTPRSTVSMVEKYNTLQSSSLIFVGWGPGRGCISHFIMSTISLRSHDLYVTAAKKTSFKIVVTVRASRYFDSSLAHVGMIHDCVTHVHLELYLPYSEKESVWTRKASDRNLHKREQFKRNNNHIVWHVNFGWR